MASTQLFQSCKTGRTKATDTNLAGGKAYALTSEQALAQYAATCCLGSTFYASAEEQLDEALRLASECSPKFIAQAAIYSREVGKLKDFPALLLAYLCSVPRDTNVARYCEAARLFESTFPRVITNGRMLRNFVQIIRSGKLGRKSFGTMPRRVIRNWLATRTDDQLFRDSVGQSPSLSDIIKMVHPKPVNETRKALYRYLIGREVDWYDKSLPVCVREYQKWQAGRSVELPNVPFQMLTNQTLTEEQWATIAANASYQMTRMNLNTFERHGVFKDSGVVQLIAERLRNKTNITIAKQFPYQLYQSFEAASGVPSSILDALQDAIDTAVENVPCIDGKVVVCPDVSSSMYNPVTGFRGKQSTAVSCCTVAGLIAAAILKNNPEATILPFSSKLFDSVRFNHRDSVATITKQISSLIGGGTHLSLPMAHLVQTKAKVDLIVYVSDNESWMDDDMWSGSTASLSPFFLYSGVRDKTETVRWWKELKKLNPKCKMVCVDLTPNATTQAHNDKDVLNVGGFSDAVFEVISSFMSTKDADMWVNLIKGIQA